MARLRELLAGAERPFVILGGGGWSPAAVADIRAFVEANQLPVGTSFRCADRLDNSHPNYAGPVGIGLEPGLERRIKEADVLLVVGARLGEITTGGYRLIDIPRPRQRLIHVHAGAGDAGFQRLDRRVPEAEPLQAHGRHVAGLGRVGGDEARLGQGLGQQRRQGDQVVAGSAEAVQQDTKVFGVIAAGRPETGSG